MPRPVIVGITLSDADTRGTVRRTAWPPGHVPRLCICRRTPNACLCFCPVQLSFASRHFPYFPLPGECLPRMSFEHARCQFLSHPASGLARISLRMVRVVSPHGASCLP